MKQTTCKSLAALCLAACALILPPRAGAETTNPNPGLTQPITPNPTLTTPTDTPPPPAKPGKRETYPFRGVVASIDTTARTVTLEGRGTRRVISVLPETRLLRGDAPATLDDVKAGEKVGGTLRKNPDGRETALLLRVGDKPAGPANQGKKRALTGAPPSPRATL